MSAPVPLPKRPSPPEHSPAVWSVQPPTVLKCSRHDSERHGVCCKDIVEDQSQLVSPDIVRDVVIGLSDGLTVPFALTAGLSSLGTSKLVVLGGVAELIAGAISMGIGGFLASQAERDYYRFLRRTTAARVARSCEGEIEREVASILRPIGVDDDISTSVARCLRDIEVRTGSDGSISRSSDIEHADGLKWSKDVGVTHFLLKFGEGLEEVPNRRMYTSAFNIGLGYLIGGIIPLIPYFFIPTAFTALMYSCVLTGTVLLIFGAIKARVTGAAGKEGGVKSYLWGAVSTLFVGGAAAGAAFVIVAALERGE